MKRPDPDNSPPLWYLTSISWSPLEQWHWWAMDEFGEVIERGAGHTSLGAAMESLAKFTAALNGEPPAPLAPTTPRTPTPRARRPAPGT